MSMPPQLSILTLGVADLDRSIDFYRALGWRQAGSSVPGVIAWFDIGGAWLGLFPTEELAADAGLKGPDAARGPFDGVTMAINLADEAAVDAALAAAVAAGGALRLPARRLDWGLYGGYVADLDGHLWELAYNPTFPIRPGGGIDIP